MGKALVPWLFGMRILAGAMIAIQRALNATLGERLGNLGSVLVLTMVSIAVLVMRVVLFPSTARFAAIPRFDEWYLCAGGALGVVILAAPIFLVPRIGATSTLVAIVMGRLSMALLVDPFGLFSSPTIVASPRRMIGVALGAFLVGR